MLHSPRGVRDHVAIFLGQKPARKKKKQSTEAEKSSAKSCSSSKRLFCFQIQSEQTVFSSPLLLAAIPALPLVLANKGRREIKKNRPTFQAKVNKTSQKSLRFPSSHRWPEWGPLYGRTQNETKQNKTNPPKKAAQKRA